MITGSHENLERMFKRADPIDLDEGMLAYQRYHMVMGAIADRYGFPIDKVCAAFCSLSPNSDYKGNLRSTISVLQGVNAGKRPDEITVATYSHCKVRAWEYATGSKDFMQCTTGPKIKNFYKNILHPLDPSWCTIDGHMSAIWQGRKLTMKEALIPSRFYERIKSDVSDLAFVNGMLPNQMQAVLWFTRKRVSNVVYDAQLKLFGDSTDVWDTLQQVDDLKPYPVTLKTMPGTMPDPHPELGLD